jgi:hypothetical protein
MRETAPPPRGAGQGAKRRKGVGRLMPTPACVLGLLGEAAFAARRRPARAAPSQASVLAGGLGLGQGHQLVVGPAAGGRGRGATDRLWDS